MFRRTPGIFDSDCRHEPALPALGNRSSIRTRPGSAARVFMAPPDSSLSKAKPVPRRPPRENEFTRYGTVVGRENSYPKVGNSATGDGVDLDARAPGQRGDLNGGAGRGIDLEMPS